MFAHELAKHGQKVALISDQGERVTYSELDTKVQALINTLPSFTEKHKCLFLLPAHASISFVIAYLASLISGHALLLVSPDISKQWLEDIQKNYQAHGIFTLENAMPELQVLEGQRFNIHSDLALMLSTSGSTGSPKQVKLSYQNLQANAQSIAAYLNMVSSDVAITSLPLSYSYGLSVLNSHLLVGASIVLSKLSIVEKSFWSLMEEHAVTSFSGVPYTYELLRRLRLEKKQLPALRYMTQAGGKLDKDNVVYFANILKEQGKRFYVMYGQTEATARISYVPPELILDNADSIGIAIPTGQLTLWDENDTEITDSGRVGELVYYGDNVMMGYALSSTDLSTAPELNYLKTGDLAYRDAHGLYTITGRKSRFIKLFGNRIDLDLVEQHLIAEKLTTACVGNDKTLHVFLLETAKEKGVKDFIYQHYAIHPSVIYTHVIEHIPRNNNGKIHYSALNKQAGIA